MNHESEYGFFKLRKEAKTYLSKVFSFDARNTVRVRQVKMVIEGSDQVHLGEIEGAMCLRLTGNVRKTQVSALIKTTKRSDVSPFRPSSPGRGTGLNRLRRMNSLSVQTSSLA
jgi:hypothetical protein